MADSSVIIIGAGIAGLTAGVYAQMNGYSSKIFEMHSLPGGLMTAWKRKGYTIESCIHWLVGSNPKSKYYKLWQEIGLAQNRQFVNLDEFARVEGLDGRTLIFYTDLDRLEQHLLSLAPEDEKEIHIFIQACRRLTKLKMSAEDVPETMTPLQSIRMLVSMLPHLPLMRKYMLITTKDYIGRFHSPLLREAFSVIWPPEFSIAFLMFTLAWLHNRDAGYPIGGSLPMADAVEQRFLSLGGEVCYNSRVEKILVEDNRAVGVRLTDGSEHRADYVISAADGHATIFDMLEGRYIDDKLRKVYDTYPTFPALVFVGIGVKQDFAGFPKMVSGINFPLNPPIRIGEKTHDRLDLRILNYDPTLAPAGKTVLTVTLEGDYAYWTRLYRNDRAEYEARKYEAGQRIIEAIDRRYNGLAYDVEMVDVATPATYERYTGNWKASFEGWLMTPQNAMSSISKTLPGLKNFFMAGQWVQPGGGIPSGLQTGRAVVAMMCKQDKKPFASRKD